MAISKIILNGVTQMDLTQDTVAAANLISPNTAHDAAGLPVTGTATAGIDLPIFSTVYDSDNDYQLVSIACNKTYSELYALEEDGLLAGALEHATVTGSYSYEYEATLAVIGHVGRPSESTFPPPGDYLDFISSVSQPYYDICLKSDDEIYVVKPSACAKTLNVTANGTYEPEYGDYSYVKVNVNVPTPTPTLQSKTATPTESQQTITADSGYDGLSSVEVGAISSTYVGSGIDRRSSSDLAASGATVTVPAGYYAEAASTSVASGSATTPASTITVTPGISISSAGLITATASGSKSITPSVSAGYVTSGTAGTVTVNGSNTSQLSTQAAATITPSQTLQTAVAAGKYTTGAVTVAAIPNDYIGSGITQRDETDLTASGATVTVPAGYYASQQTKSIASGSAATPASTITANPSISVNSSGLITATVSGSKSITPTVSAGYVSAGTAGTVTVSGSNTSQLTTLGATTYNTSTTDQTISSGRYLTGTQTIRAVTISGITAANIKAGTTVSVGDSADADRIVGVTGTFTADATAAASDIVSGQTAYVNGSKVTGSLVVQTYYTGSSTPSSSLGVNGDIYIQA